MRAPGSSRTREVPRFRDKRTDNPCRWRDGPCRVWSPATSTRSRGYRVWWTRRALPALGSCPTFKHPLGEGREEAPPSVPDEPKLNKATPVRNDPRAHLSSLAQGTSIGTTQPLGLCQRQDHGDWQPRGPGTGQGPKPQASGLLKGAGSGPVAS